MGNAGAEAAAILGICRMYVQVERKDELCNCEGGWLMRCSEGEEVYRGPRVDRDVCRRKDMYVHHIPRITQSQRRFQH
jgi:hypothetical protein